MIGKYGIEYIRLDICETSNKGSARYFVCLGGRIIQGEYDVPNREIFSCSIMVEEILRAIDDEKKRDGVES